MRIKKVSGINKMIILKYLLIISESIILLCYKIGIFNTFQTKYYSNINITYWYRPFNIISVEPFKYSVWAKKQKSIFTQETKKIRSSQRQSLQPTYNMKINIKYLGVKGDKSLTWEPHMNQTLEKIQISQQS